MSDTPWYHEGLRFRCTECGDCCTGAPGFVWVNQEEIEVLAQAVGLRIDEFLDKYTRKLHGHTSLIEFPTGDCVFFDNVSRKCAVYHHRPRQCRTWPFWESNLETPADWAEAARSCPGIGQGPLVTGDTIEQLVRVIRV